MTASCAKCLTQRQRRRDHMQKDAKNSKHGKGHKKGGGKGGVSQLSNNMLTPGVPFMVKLTSGLEYYVASRLLPNGLLKNCEGATVSGAHAIGEGEHKIVSQMLRNAGAGGMNESHVIFSGDADIFLLSLVQNACRKVRVVSERPQDHSGSKRKRGPMLQIWNAEVLAQCISQELSRAPAKGPRCGTEASLRRDFALVALFAGNDYLPELKCGRSAQQLWNEYLTLRRSDFPAEPLLQTLQADALPLSHSEGGWALTVQETGASFSAEPYEHFVFHQPFLAALMRRAPNARGVGAALAEEAAEGSRKYLEGLLWIMEMYHHGYCGDFYFVMEKRLHTHASAANIVQLLEELEAEGGEPLAPPRSHQPPMRPLSCAMCILPVQHAEQFLAPAMPALRPMFSPDHPLLGAVNAIEKSDDLVAYRGKVATLQQEMMALRAQGLDDTMAKAELTKYSQMLSDLRKGAGGDIDTVSLQDVDAEVVQRCSSRPSPVLNFAPDVTLLRDVAAAPCSFDAPARGMPRVQCRGLKRVTGEWPSIAAPSNSEAELDAWEDTSADDGSDGLGGGSEALAYDEAEDEFGEPEGEAEDKVEYASSLASSFHMALEVMSHKAPEVQEDPDVPGAIVEGYWPDDDTWLPASVVAVHDDGSMTIAWDDGATQSQVPADYVRRPQKAPARTASAVPLSRPAAHSATMQTRSLAAQPPAAARGAGHLPATVTRSTPSAAPWHQPRPSGPVSAAKRPRYGGR